MDKILALTFMLLPQPIVGFLIWFSMDKLFTSFGLKEMQLLVLTIIAAVVLYSIFCFFFARGFLGSSEAKKLGF